MVYPSYRPVNNEQVRNKFEELWKISDLDP